MSATVGEGPHQPVTAPRGLINSMVPFSSVDGPGGRFVIFMQGCNFDCISCQNPTTIDATGLEEHPANDALPDDVGKKSETRWMTVDEIVESIRSALPFIRGVTVSGGEPTLQTEFLIELFREIRGSADLSRLSILIDSNGAAPIEVWERLAPLIDGVMVDLKALDPVVHETLTGHDNAIVLRSIRHLAKTGKLKEVEVLPIPGHNADDRSIYAASSWVHTVARGVPIGLLRFRSDHVRPIAADIVEPTDEEMEHMRELMMTSNVMVTIA
ncbi:MAG: radical SAM protein [Acidimicrobiia bacterium]|nr:radical SAM protein [Acidimicrobiia bacterium]